jgi:hypothetical protein
LDGGGRGDKELEREKDKEESHDVDIDLFRICYEICFIFFFRKDGERNTRKRKKCYTINFEEHSLQNKARKD